MRNGQSVLMSCLLLATCAAPDLRAAEPAKSGDRKKPAAATKPVPAFTLDLAAAMADPPAWSAGHAAQLAAMEKIAADAEGSVETATAHLAIANWLLAVPTSHAATRWLVELADDKDLALLADSAKAAREHIEKAKKQLSAASQPGHPQEKDAQNRASKLDTVADSLEPFTALLAAAKIADSDERARQGTWTRVARGLSAVRESTDTSLAASALLWQAFAWQMAGRTERAKNGLPEPLTPPANPSYDFMARLLRCRLLGEAGQYTAATTLAIEVRQECANWFKGETTSGAIPRERLAALVQCQLAKRWQAHLKAATAPVSTGPLEAMLGQLQATYFDDRGEGRPQVYFINATIPVIIHPPDAKVSVPTEKSGSEPGEDAPTSSSPTADKL